MKKLFKTVGFLILMISLVTFSSCETTNLELTENPNELPISASNPDLLFHTQIVRFVKVLFFILKSVVSNE
jgi:hypothetical protein